MPVMPRRPKRHAPAPQVLTYSEFYKPTGKDPSSHKKSKTPRPSIPLTERIALAVKELGSSRGVSFVQIKKYLDAEYPCSESANPKTIRAFQRHGVNRAVEAGLIRPHALHSLRYVRSPLKKKTKTKKAVKKAATSTKKAQAASPAAKRAPKQQEPKRAPKKKKSSGTMKRADSVIKKAEEMNAAIVDKAAGVKGSIHGTYSCSLKLIDLSQNVDKYFFLQVIELDDATGYLYFARWGNTGTSGESSSTKFDTSDEATAEFEKTFEENTGNKWGEDFTEIDGKYKLIVANDEPLDDDVIWQYWVDDGVDGKSQGWYNYDDEASETVESVYQENTRNSNMEVRCVHSGHFNYRVDFKTMTQTNLTHNAHKQRKIRRGLRSD